jgi:hypothetical protein
VAMPLIKPGGKSDETRRKKSPVEDTAAAKTQDSGSKVLVVIWCVIAIEILLDLSTTIIAFTAYTKGNGDECCGEQIDFGNSTLGIAIPYFLLIFFELCVLGGSITATLYGPGYPSNWCGASFVSRCCSCSGDASESESEDSIVKRILSLIFTLNPYFGFLVSWGLLYQSNKNEAIAVLSVQTLSLLLQWVTFYLRETSWTKWNVFVCLIIPTLPFVVFVVVIVVYLQEGGVCYRNGSFWYEGCEVCPNGFPSDHRNGTCLEFLIDQGTYCANHNDPFVNTTSPSFCWFPY